MNCPVLFSYSDQKKTVCRPGTLNQQFNDRADNLLYTQHTEKQKEGIV